MKYLIILAIIGCFFTCGCQRGDIRLSPVIQGQIAPHDGYLLSPEIYVYQGQTCKMTGAILWINGLDPNSIGVE